MDEIVDFLEKWKNKYVYNEKRSYQKVENEYFLYIDLIVHYVNLHWTISGNGNTFASLDNVKKLAESLDEGLEKEYFKKVN
jgi:hypothetical protein